MENTPSWTDMVQAICAVGTLLITFFGFIYVIKQLNSAKKANQISTYENLYARMYEIHTFLYEHLELREYFYNSRILLVGDKHYGQIMIVTEMFADFIQQIWLQSDLMPEKTAQGWRSYARSIVSTSPTLYAFLQDHKDWYPSMFFVNPDTTVGQLKV